MSSERWERTKQILEEALRLVPEQRRAYLDSACDADAELRAEVESLIASHNEAGSKFLAGGAADVLQLSSSGYSCNSNRAALNQTIGHYRLLEEIGRGGMGVVYKAEDIRLHRFVALKFLPDEVAKDPQALERFRREAQAASALNHPNICTIYDIGEEDGRPFIAMELIEGETLRQRIQDQPLALEPLLDLGIQITDALEAAHSAGIIHRDIKPANVFVTKRGQVKVLDFGLAKLMPKALLGSEPVGAPRDWESLTVVGVITGTPSYMSPEQVRGDPLDAHTDLFSLGAVLYEMATGRQAFTGNTGGAIIEAILTQAPASAMGANREVPSELERIINKALEKDRERRYQHAADVRGDLRRLKREIESGRAAVASVETSLATASTLTRARWLAVTGVGALVIGLTVSGWLRYSGKGHLLTAKNTVVIADFNNSTGDPAFDGTLQQALSAQLEQSPFLNPLSDARVRQTLALMAQPTNGRVTHEIAREVCQRTGGAATVEGSISALGSQYVLGLAAVNCESGDVLAQEQQTAAAKEQVLASLGSAATKIRRKLGESLASIQTYDAPMENVTTASLEALKAYTLGLSTRHEKGEIAAIPFLQQAVQLDPNFAMAYVQLGIEYGNIGEATQAKENYEKAFALRDRVSAKERFSIASMYYDSVEGDLLKAEAIFQLWAKTYPQDPYPLTHLGNDYLLSGQYPKALEVLLEEKRLAGDGYYVYVNLAWAYANLDRLREARLTIEDAFKRQLEPIPGHILLYLIDFLEGDQGGMRKELAWAAEKPDMVDTFLSMQSDTEAYFGHRRAARVLSQRAVETARRNNKNEVAAIWLANAALREAEFGNSARAVRTADSALGLAPSRDVKILVALALARSGLAKRAEGIGRQLAEENPSNTILNFYWLPTTRAAIELDQNHPEEAIEILRAAQPYELGAPLPLEQGTLYPVYVRGEALLRLGEASQAAEEFQKLLDHPGCVMNFPLGALAHLSLGRASALQGDRAKARAAYQDFLSLWKDADSDIPVLKQAKAEYAKLQ